MLFKSSVTHQIKRKLNLGKQLRAQYIYIYIFLLIQNSLLFSIYQMFSFQTTDYSISAVEKQNQNPTARVKIES